jgi:hypothetical protein
MTQMARTVAAAETMAAAAMAGEAAMVAAEEGTESRASSPS